MQVLRENYSFTAFLTTIGNFDSKYSPLHHQVNDDYDDHNCNTRGYHIPFDHNDDNYDHIDDNCDDLG